MRKRSLETFTESQNRNSEEITPKRTRNNGNNTISYLTAKYESESNLRKEELALRREEIETTKSIHITKTSKEIRTFNSWYPLKRSYVLLETCSFNCRFV